MTEQNKDYGMGNPATLLSYQKKKEEEFIVNHNL